MNNPLSSLPTLTQRAIASGWITPPAPRHPRPRKTRAILYAAGLTSTGQPRRNASHPNLAGLTGRDYHTAYMRAWRKLITHHASLAISAFIFCSACSTAPLPSDHALAMERMVEIRANVPMDIARARARGPAAVSAVTRSSQRWLLGTRYCTAADQADLALTLKECLSFSGNVSEAKAICRPYRWAYLSGLIAAPSVARSADQP